MKSSTLLAALAIAIVASTVAAAGTEDFTLKMDVGGNTTTTYVSARAVRQVEPVVNVDVIYRLQEGKIITLDHKRKTYSEMTVAQARERSTQVAANMNPSKKAMMDKMGMNAAPAVTRLGAGETIAGYATEKYLIKTPMMETTAWAAPALTMPAAYFEAATAKTSGLPGFGGVAQLGRKEINGAVLKQVATMTLNHVSVTRVATSVEKGALPASTFEPPPGYKKD